MKLISTILFSYILTSCGQTIPQEKSVTKNDTYKIILRTEMPEPDKDPETGELYTTEIPGEIDTTSIEKLNEPLKALIAFYSAMGGSMCSGEYCDLTTALGLGKQGSDKHKNLIKTYFPNDKVAETVLKQDCYLRPSGASTFSDFEFLTITDKGDSVFVDYKLMYYNRGEIVWTEGPDIYLFKVNKFEKVKRHLWTHSDK
ncbi:MAG: hypothetical protein R6W78_14685 [Bacteroidales bacterium]